jgi:hypothetical protein
MIPHLSLSLTLPLIYFRLKPRGIVSASSPFVDFGEPNDNTIKSLTSLLSVEQKIEFIAYTCGLWNEKCI